MNAINEVVQRKEMKRAIVLLVGVIFITAGTDTQAISAYQLFHGQWVWFSIFVAGGSLALSGVRLIIKDKVRDIFEDLFFVLVRTH